MRILTATALIALATSPALADESRAYAGLEFGLTSAIDSEFEGTPLNLEDDKHLGSVAGLFVGRELNDWRYEFGYTYRRNIIDFFEVQNAAGLDLDDGFNHAGGAQKSHALMGSALYKIAETDDWKTYVGLGLGFAKVRWDRSRSGRTLFVDDSDWSLAGQAMAQIVRPISDTMEFAAGYRYFRTKGTTFETQAGPANARAAYHDLFARITWKFGEPAKAKPAAAPAPVPVAAPAPKPTPKPAPKPEPKPVPLPGPFMVFFDFDKSDITDDAAGIIRAAARAYKDSDVRSVITIGHTDLAGRDAYNMALSERRVDAVKAALVSQGVPADKIGTSFKGESSPMIATEDGTREAKNRRVEIILKR